MKLAPRLSAIPITLAVVIAGLHLHGSSTAAEAPAQSQPVAAALTAPQAKIEFATTTNVLDYPLPVVRDAMLKAFSSESFFGRCRSGINDVPGVSFSTSWDDCAPPKLAGHWHGKAVATSLSPQQTRVVIQPQDWWPRSAITNMTAPFPQNFGTNTALNEHYLAELKAALEQKK